MTLPNNTAFSIGNFIFLLLSIPVLFMVDVMMVLLTIGTRIKQLFMRKV
jgi:hypothetical protein